MVEAFPGTSRGDSKRGIVTLHESNKLEIRTEEEGGQLLPGIPNDLTVHQIAPKLPWTAFHSLSSVSCGWRRVIHSRHVFDARVRSKSTQTLVAMQHRYSNNQLSKFVLYSLKDGSADHLPPIPGLQRIPEDCECVSLDGKLYVLGGFRESTVDLASAKVYVLDVAGQRQWKQCASMATPRAQFGCGVFNGKIYVFGGADKLLPGCESDMHLPVRGSEVYDPEEDTWSPITPMRSFRSDQKVTTVGEELFVYNGLVYAPDFLEWAQDRVFNPDDVSMYDHFDIVYSAEVYNPIKDEWRTVEPFNRNPLENFVLLMAEGEPRMVNSLGLHIYDRHANSWTLSQSFSFEEIGPRDTYRVSPWAAVAVDGVLLVDAIWRSWPGHVEYIQGVHEVGSCRMISQGLGGENKEMVFQNAECPYSEIMCLVQL